MAGRPRLPISTFGAVTTTQVSAGVFRAVTRFRDWDGQTRKVTATSSRAALPRRQPSTRIWQPACMPGMSAVTKLAQVCLVRENVRGGLVLGCDPVGNDRSRGALGIGDTADQPLGVFQLVAHPSKEAGVRHACPTVVATPADHAADDHYVVV